MADVFGVPVVGMVEDEGAALGGALQAAWCVARHGGNAKAKISDFTTGIVAVKEDTRCLPDRANVARYRELQAVQDELSLQPAGGFFAAAQAGGRVIARILHTLCRSCGPSTTPKRSVIESVQEMRAKSKTAAVCQ